MEMTMMFGGASAGGPEQPSTIPAAAATRSTEATSFLDSSALVMGVAILPQGEAAAA